MRAAHTGRAIDARRSSSACRRGRAPRRAVRPVLLALVCAAAAAGPAAAQTYPLLDTLAVRLITEEISGDAAYEHVRYMSQFHRPRGGSDGLWTVAQYMERKAREYGLADVRLIRQATTTRPWNARFADLWIVEPAERIASTLQTPLALVDYSRPADVTAELVDVGGGTPAELDARDVRGRIVLTHGPVVAVMRDAVIARGALGIVWYASPFDLGSGTVGGGLNMPGQIRWVTVPPGPIDGGEPTFAFVLSSRDGVALRNRLLASPEPIRVRAVVDAAFASQHGTDPWQVMVEAYIRGTEPGHAQDVVLTGHLQEEATSANDDASGSAGTLEIARALNRLIEEGRLPRPRRSLRFWWVTEISSQRQYFADHPDSHRSIWVNINQDMTGADQSQDIMRKQNITRVAATRFHFLNDVAEAAVEYMVRTNTFELAQAQNGIPLYPRAHLAKLGSQHRYNAEMIFFHNNTDHMPFHEAPIGIPGITFTNMPDRYIHSSDDDLWNIDRTQLGRNAATAALIAYTMAAAADVHVPALAAETVGRGGERLARNVRLGLSWIAAAGDRDAVFHDAEDQVRYAAARERLALQSLADIGPAGARRVDALLAELARREAQALREVGAYHRQLAGRAPARRTLSEAETRLAALRPVLAGGPREFLTARGRIQGVPGLHALMAFEVLNAVDGRRSGLDILRYVAAEAREAGAHYYGVVRPADVLRYLENVAETGLIRLN